MADNEGDENMPRGNEWEVVQLTASTYAAAPGPDDAEQKDEDKVAIHSEVDAETSDALFYSGHFVFPPSQHENLPLEPDCSEILDEVAKEDTATEPIVEEGDRSAGKDADNWMFKGLDIAEEFPGIPIFDEKGNRIPIPGAEFDEGRKLPMMHTKDKEKSLYGTGTYSSFHSEADIGGQTPLVENLGIADVNELSERDLDFPMDLSPSPTSKIDDEYERSKLPCDAWWKRTAASLYAQAKETNTFWSIFVAAAVMGLVIIGQHWQQERSKVLQLKWQISVNNERNGKLLGPIYRLKDVIVGGHRRGSLIGGGSSSEN